MRNVTRFMLLLALAGLALLTVQVIGCDGWGAPAPFPKDRDERPASMVGEWHLQWGPGMQYKVVLSADGSVSMEPYHYRGVWHLKNRTIFISEAVNDCWSHYSIKLDRQMTGVPTYMESTGPRRASITVKFTRVR